MKFPLPLVRRRAPGFRLVRRCAPKLPTATALLLAMLLAACSRNEPPRPAAAAAPSAIAKDIPAGAYELDPAHASLIFRVNHLGFSHYTARFKRLNAQLQFDPNNLAAAQLTADVDARSIETDFPDSAKLDFNAELQSEQWLNAVQYPQMQFRSTRIEVTGSNTLRLTGELTLRGVTKPVVLDTTFNGGYAGHPMDPRARIGFSAHGTLQRSDFGISFGIPAPGTTLGVSDQVDISIEAEFSGPPLPGATETATGGEH
jgi:polyisoprenoid-binding protein YceI